MKLLIRINVCIIALGVFFFLYLDTQIEIMRLRLKVPQLAKELKVIQEENVRLKYQIDQFESPENLLYLSRKPQFSHLKQPNQDEIIILNQ